MITLIDVAVGRGAQQAENGSFSGAEFDKVGLPLTGGCQACGAVIAAYNAAPTKTGWLSCATDACAGDQGFATIAEFEAFTETHFTA